MKLKLLSIAALACFSVGAAHAQGFYVGGTIGALSLTSKSTLNLGPIDLTPLNIAPNLNAGVNIPVDLGDTGFDGRLYAGYLFDIAKNFCLGLEANAEFNTASAEASSTVSVTPFVPTISILNTRLDVKNSYGLSLLPTFHISDDFLVYGRAGLAYGTINSSITGPLWNINDSTHEMGGQFGVGMEYSLSKHVSLRGEYIYTIYRSLDQSVTPSVAGFQIPMNFSHKVNTSAFGLGLTYRI